MSEEIKPAVTPQPSTEPVTAPAQQPVTASDAPVTQTAPKIDDDQAVWRNKYQQFTQFVGTVNPALLDQFKATRKNPEPVTAPAPTVPQKPLSGNDDVESFINTLEGRMSAKVQEAAQTAVERFQQTLMLNQEKQQANATMHQAIQSMGLAPNDPIVQEALGQATEYGFDVERPGESNRFAIAFLKELRMALAQKALMSGAPNPQEQIAAAGAVSQPAGPAAAPATPMSNTEKLIRQMQGMETNINRRVLDD